jgi:hypothetical protein
MHNGLPLVLAFIGLGIWIWGLTGAKHQRERPYDWAADEEE